MLDVGCGRGSFAQLLARHGSTVVGIDPAGASLDMARAKGGGSSITWRHGDAAALPPLHADLAVMTGNVAQVFLSDDDWTATLRGIRRALARGGHLVFETRRPERHIWEEWAADTAPVVRDLPLVSFRYTYRFLNDGAVISSDSTLRFRSRDEVERSLLDMGYTLREVRDAPDRPGREYVFIAERA